VAVAVAKAARAVTAVALAATDHRLLITR